MGQYIQRRLLLLIPLLLLVTILSFMLLQLTPGDPLNAYVPPDAPMPAEARARLRHQLGLDKPAAERYFYWLRETVQGNLGVSTSTFEPVRTVIGRRIGPTLLLMGTALVIGVGLGLVFGIVAALRRNTWLDLVLTGFAILGISVPVYLAGLIGLYVFSLRLGWFPTGGFAAPDDGSALDHVRHLILPALIIAIQYIASTMRYTRGAMIEAMAQDYVRTARAKGLKNTTVVTRHALKNALLPIVTIVGSYVPALIAGAVFIESIFSWPGMGQLFIDSVTARDYPLIMGLILVLAIIILVANLLTDIAYAIIDPRIRYE